MRPPDGYTNGGARLCSKSEARCSRRDRAAISTSRPVRPGPRSGPSTCGRWRRSSSTSSRRRRTCAAFCGRTVHSSGSTAGCWSTSTNRALRAPRSASATTVPVPSTGVPAAAQLRGDAASAAPRRSCCGWRSGASWASPCWSGWARVADPLRRSRSATACRQGRSRRPPRTPRWRRLSNPSRSRSQLIGVGPYGSYVDVREQSAAGHQLFTGLVAAGADQKYDDALDDLAAGIEPDRPAGQCRRQGLEPARQPDDVPRHQVRGPARAQDLTPWPAPREPRSSSPVMRSCGAGSPTATGATWPPGAMPAASRSHG